MRNRATLIDARYTIHSNQPPSSMISCSALTHRLFKRTLTRSKRCRWLRTSTNSPTNKTIALSKFDPETRLYETHAKITAWHPATLWKASCCHRTHPSHVLFCYFDLWYIMFCRKIASKAWTFIPTAWASLHCLGVYKNNLTCTGTFMYTIQSCIVPPTGRVNPHAWEHTPRTKVVYPYHSKPLCVVKPARNFSSCRWLRRTWDTDTLFPVSRPLMFQQIIAQAQSFVTAGTETTASALAFTIHLISQHPEVQARLLAEIDASGPSSQWVTERDTRKVRIVH